MLMLSFLNIRLLRSMHFTLSLVLLFFLLNKRLCLITKTAEVSPPSDYILPLPVAGACYSNSSWVITDVMQLYGLIGDLECLWAASLTPAAVPLGYNYGRLLAFTNSAVLDLFTRPVYQGDFTFETQCFGRRHIISLVKFGSTSQSYGIWSINKFPLPIANEEFYDGREAIIMDFSIDLKSLCRGEGAEGLRRHSYSLYSMRPFQTGSWPMRLFIDLLRVVGCDKDNGILLLGRTFMLDPDRTLNKPAFTVLYFVLKTFDKDVVPVNFQCGDSIFLNNGFKYQRHGAEEFLVRLNPSRYTQAYYSGRLRNGIFNYQ